MLNNLRKSWKTSSLGLTSIVGIVVHLVFAVRAGTAGEEVWTTSLIGIILAAGLIFAGDASATNHQPPQTPPTTP